jgi:hypothetical protein
MNQFKMPIIASRKLNMKRYSSSLKKDEKYKDAIDDALATLSENLVIPYFVLYNALFFKKGTNAKEILVLK